MRGFRTATDAQEYGAREVRCFNKMVGEGNGRAQGVKVSGIPVFQVSFS